ncbi:hypothetical protein [Tenacibaculum halocynthiae]|uniref:hypothetical protein n=1 Tax=Tenacibaculum halocynthiae TaxID=1254437 RepID=UPI003D64F4F3
MLKNISTLGIVLNTIEQKSINGGKLLLDPIKKIKCKTHADCPGGGVCATFEKPTGDYPKGKYCL